jgi:hypothetical protein
MRTRTILLAILMAPLGSFAAPNKVGAQGDVSAGLGRSPSSTTASDKDQREILSTLIAAVGYRAPLPPPSGPDQVRDETGPTVVLIDQPIVFCSSGARGLQDECTTEIQRSDLAPVEAELSKGLVNDFWMSSTEVHSGKQPPLGGVVMSRSGDIKKLLASSDGWQRFHQMYSPSAGVSSATRAVLTGDQRHALIYVAYRCGTLCGFGQIHYLVRTKDGWRLEHSYRLWVS